MIESIDQYIENDEVIGFIKAYKESNFEFVGFMPKNNFDHYIQKLTGEKINQVLESNKQGKAEIIIPKFTIENSIDLKSILEVGDDSCI